LYSVSHFKLLYRVCMKKFCKFFYSWSPSLANWLKKRLTFSSIMLPIYFSLEMSLMGKLYVAIFPKYLFLYLSQSHTVGNDFLMYYYCCNFLWFFILAMELICVHSKLIITNSMWMEFIQNRNRSQENSRRSVKKNYNNQKF